MQILDQNPSKERFSDIIKVALKKFRTVILPPSNICHHVNLRDYHEQILRF